MQGIYRIHSKNDDKNYVGSSKNIERRLEKHHLSLLRKNKHWNKYLQSAWNKYGELNFEFIPVEEVHEESNLLDREDYWMIRYKTLDRNFGYNLVNATRTIISDEIREKMRLNGIKRGAPLGSGWHHTQEAKQKISKAGKRRIGMKFSLSHRAAISHVQTGRSWNDKLGIEKSNQLKIATSKRMLGHKFNLGRKASEETKKKQSWARSGYKHSLETKLKCKLAKYQPIDIKIQEQIIHLYINESLSCPRIARIIDFTNYKVRSFLKEKKLWKQKK